MPQFVEHEATAATVRKGDVISGHQAVGPAGYVVSSVDAKDKWTTINFESDFDQPTKRRVLNDTPVVVLRSEPTAEEREARTLEIKIMSIKQSIEVSKKRFAAATAKQVAALTSENGWGLDWGVTGDLAEAQFTARRWAEVEYVAKNILAKNEDMNEDVALLTAYDNCHERALEQVMGYRASVSTHVLSNALNAYEMESYAKFARGHLYY